MRTSLRWGAGILAIFGLVTPAIAADTLPSSDRIEPFLENYCVECHNTDEAKGDRSFDALASAITTDNDLVDYQDILDQLNLSEMPPPDAVQPSDTDRIQIIEALTAKIAAYHESRTDSGGRTVLRRLNAREYRNTVRDLLQLETTLFDPTTKFPRDQTIQHFDNIGDQLVTSSHLLSRYLDAADQVITRALHPLKKPAPQTWVFKDRFRQQPEVDSAHRAANGWKYITLYDVVGADKPEGAYGPILDFAEGVPHNGTYEIRFQAEAVNRDHPYDDDLIGTNRDQPLRLGIVPGNHDFGELHLPQPVEPLLAEFELTDDKQWYTAQVHLDRGYSPRFTFRNGLMDVRNLWSRLIRKYPDRFAPNLNGIVAFRKAAIADGKLPQIRIHQIEISGPIIQQWPTPSQRILLGDDSTSISSGDSPSDADPRRVDLTLQQSRGHIARFASRAYRRDASQSEVDQVMRVVRSRRDAGQTPMDALADGFKTILCSPNFLYLDETSDNANGNGSLSQHAIASRLSYFLWSSMPDQALRDLADQGRLTDRDELRRQVRRMLADKRSDAMVRSFLDTWLALRDLGSAPPDRRNFSAYYRHDLGTAMRDETEAFFRHILDQNLSVDQFIDSDFTFVNQSLAELYAIDDVDSHVMRRVALNDRRRGGLLGQSSVLTVSANGIDTSPVVRGVWLLDNLLGTPPSPPPPDVEPLDPDTRGAKTIREQLAKHRDVTTCNECHRRIDPLGFALENYDPIGRWRTKYPSKANIDASGELPDGQSFRDVGELKRILLGRKSQFARSMAEKMLAYSIGRQTVPADRPAIDKIADADGLRDLIELVVLSKPFQTN
ncbi:hypothetical protein K227x_29360 [Rubripirellula lacrimiformis]|uniref:Planctomycete cytochrome C n=1 Tax=Rubripirellula lacrimiformis TaxID=1930273 RepID=A0A517NBM9_9BACT|nr:DUF1592 domain-containing protein [Rubripirellula lacrimiformis]QDT04544.1 hypothetical protein K227x_29360 [Rubripirellula lacrimiformis]